MIQIGLERILYLLIVAALIVFVLYIILRLAGAIAEGPDVNEVAEILRRHKAH